MPVCRAAAALWLCAGLLQPVQASDGHGAAPAAAPAARKAAAEAPAERAPAVAAAPAPADPMERLRERLAERLSGAKVAPVTGQAQDLRVINVAPAPTAGAAALRLQAAPAGGHGDAAPAPRARAPKAAAHGSAHWSYAGEAGPQAWGGLKPEFGMCATGQRQSPIDIREGISVDLEPVQFNYQPTGFSVIDNGHTVQVNLQPGNSIEVGGKRFDLLQFHFHRPSEERIDGRQFDLSVHLVHKDPEGRLAVVGVVVQRGSVQPILQMVWNNLPLEKNQDMRARGMLDPTHMLPADRRYYTYMGSLTTPPCSEGVQWVVMRQPVAATPEQIELFARLYPFNARPIQSAAGRRILQSN
jgi:carbonic anhydrase